MINRDTYVAVFLLLFCGLFIAATFYIRDTTYGTMQASVWPRIILVVMTLFSMILLAQALREPRDEGGQDHGRKSPPRSACTRAAEAQVRACERRCRPTSAARRNP